MTSEIGGTDMSHYQKIYETSAVNTGGRNGISYIENSSFQVTISSPKELGGNGNGTNPEQLPLVIQLVLIVPWKLFLDWKA